LEYHLAGDQDKAIDMLVRLEEVSLKLQDALENLAVNGERSPDILCVSQPA